VNKLFCFFSFIRLFDGWLFSKEKRIKRKQKRGAGKQQKETE